MKISFDPVKRAETLTKRGLDMADAGLVFAGPELTVEDDRKDYGEQRLVTVGRLRGRKGSRGPQGVMDGASSA